MPFRVVGVVALDSEEQIVSDNAKRKENWMQVRTAPVVRPARAIRPAGYGSIRIRWGRASSTTSAAGRPAYPQISRDFHRSRRIRPRLRWRERARKRLHGRVEVSPPPKIDSPDPGERKRKSSRETHSSKDCTRLRRAEEEGRRRRGCGEPHSSPVGRGNGKTRDPQDPG